MLIRNIHEADFASCVEITRRAWPEFKERPAIYHLFSKHFSNTCFVCEREGEIDALLLGFLSQVDTSVGYIHLIVVDPPAQRRGLANQLYQAFFETARNLGARQVRLTVSPENAPSLLFHKSVGFEPDLSGETIQVGAVLAVKDYNGPGLHMVPYSRPLP
jgi:ribosomal protein S18 acetylase RimI-like enzyme